ncbi:dTMP kinase [Patescibacteria group bacterium]
MASKGKFISIEGLDGCGKTTQIKLLEKYLIDQGIESVLTREPGGTPGAEEIRRVLLKGDLGKWDGIAEALLLFAGRRDHVQKTIKPALREGKVVISDRFFDSTTAFQVFGQGIDWDHINAIRQLSIGDFSPDQTIIFDMDHEKGVDRSIVKNRFENMKMDFHKRVREGYQKIAERDEERCRVLNVDGLSIPEVHKKVIKLIDPVLKQS